MDIVDELITIAKILESKEYSSFYEIDKRYGDTISKELDKLKVDHKIEKKDNKTSILWYNNNRTHAVYKVVRKYKKI